MWASDFPHLDSTYPCNSSVHRSTSSEEIESDDAQKIVVQERNRSVSDVQAVTTQAVSGVFGRKDEHEAEQSLPKYPRR